MLTLRGGKSAGFTLVELIIGIVTLAIALTALTALVFPQARQSVQPIQQMRAAQLGQSLMSEVLSRAFDQQSIEAGVLRCDEPDAPECTPASELGPETGETRDRFNDVDDYDGLLLEGAALEDALGRSIEPYFRGFSAQINVFYDAALDGTANTSTPQQTALYKRIEITVNTPDGQPVVFSAYRGNY